MKALALCALVMLSVSLSACGMFDTVTPPIVHPAAASWDKGGQNSGLVADVQSRLE